VIWNKIAWFAKEAATGHYSLSLQNKKMAAGIVLAAVEVWSGRRFTAAR
jgi:hypothetical protein